MRGNGQHGDTRQHCEDRHHEEDGTLRQKISDRTRGDGDSDIAGMVEGRVPPHAPGWPRYFTTSQLLNQNIPRSSAARMPFL
jgi:hypothetical protein